MICYSVGLVWGASQGEGKDVFSTFPCLTDLFGAVYSCAVHRQCGIWAEASDPKPVQTLPSEQGVNSGADQSQILAPKHGVVPGGSLMVCLSYARWGFAFTRGCDPVSVSVTRSDSDQRSSKRSS